MVVSAMHQHESVIITYIYNISICISPLLLEPPSLTHILPLRVIIECQAGLLVYSAFLLVICFIHNSVHMSMLLSQFILPSYSPTVSTSLFSTSAPPFLQSYFSRFHIYALIYDTFFPLTCFTLYTTK